MVYLISDGEYTKIGKADNGIDGVNNRLLSLQTGNPKELKIIKTFKGSYSLESLLHRSLSNYRVRGEWFLIDFDIDEEMIECFRHLDKEKIVKKHYLCEQDVIDSIYRISKLKKLITTNKIAEDLGYGIRNVSRLMSENVKRIKHKENVKNFGSVDNNALLRGKNLENIKKSILDLKKQNKKITYLNISKNSGINRVTVSKICKKYNLLKTLNNS